MRPTVTVELLDTARCRVTHGATGESLTTAVAPEYRGPGGQFSSTDLVAAALGSCIASSIAPVAERGGLPLDSIRVEVEKQLSVSPRRIAALSVTVYMGIGISDALRLRLERAAATCPVKASLQPLVHVDIRFQTA